MITCTYPQNQVHRSPTEDARIAFLQLKLYSTSKYNTAVGLLHVRILILKRRRDTAAVIDSEA